jgi:hypothetical protein
MEIGDYIKQEGSDFVAYGRITKQLKNGSFFASVHTGYDGSTAGKTKQKSIKDWYPAPIKINRIDVPVAILNKL